MTLPNAHGQPVLETGGDDDVIEGPLYAPGKRLFPQAAHGRFRNIKWLILVITLGVYYGLPFLRWDRGPNEPHQAVLVDLAHRRFYFFFIEIWPQELYYVAGLLIMAALILFLMNAVAGRIWCGYLCPQTVWTDLFYAVERLVEGDARRQHQRQAEGWTFNNILHTGYKHALWLIIAWWTGGAWVLYFADAPTLVRELATFQAPMVAWTAIAILTVLTYLLAGFMREQVCIYMCPWPRIQAALTDEDALNVTYRYDRGEPRMSLKTGLVARSHGQAAGDCIDCNQCVAVCPTGVDIRHGSQLGCVQCGLCIDACDSVMNKIHRPHGLIAYDNENNIKRRLAGKPAIYRIIRPRTILYAVVIVAIGSVMLAKLVTRPTDGITIAHDRNPLYVMNADGSVRNAYTVQIVNEQDRARQLNFTVQGLKGAQVQVIGVDGHGPSFPIEVNGDDTRDLRVIVTGPLATAKHASIPVTFSVTDPLGKTSMSATDYFKTP